MTVTLKINQGMVTVEDVKIEGAAVVLGLAGSASIPARELDLKGTAALVTPPKPGATPFELPFIVQGSWDDPIMLPDPELLIRRSGAAAPLLNAVRERSTRDSVRSAIERLTGSTPAAGSAPAGLVRTGGPGKDRVVANGRASARHARPAKAAATRSHDRVPRLSDLGAQRLTLTPCGPAFGDQRRHNGSGRDDRDHDRTNGVDLRFYAQTHF